MPPFTKQAIIGSFVKLLNQKPLDKITVKDIVDDCGVNRNTFYYYFQDIYAITDEVFRSETSKIIQDKEIYTSWQDTLMNAAKFALENKKAIYHIYNSVNRRFLEQYLYEIAGNSFIRLVKNKAGNLPISDTDIKLISDFYKFAFVGKILEWLACGMKYDAEDIIYRAGQLIEGNIENAIQNSLKSHK